MRSSFNISPSFAQHYQSNRLTYLTNMQCRRCQFVFHYFTKFYSTLLVQQTATLTKHALQETCVRLLIFHQVLLNNTSSSDFHTYQTCNVGDVSSTFIISHCFTQHYQSIRLTHLPNMQCRRCKFDFHCFTLFCSTILS